jgi:hypothetical protein
MQKYQFILNHSVSYGEKRNVIKRITVIFSCIIENNVTRAVASYGLSSDPLAQFAVIARGMAINATGSILSIFFSLYRTTLIAIFGIPSLPTSCMVCLWCVYGFRRRAGERRLVKLI